MFAQQNLNEILSQEMSVEARTEELELRVTEMSMDIARNTKKCLAYESGFQHLLNCSSIDEVKDRVYQLQLIAGTLIYVKNVLLMVFFLRF